MATKPATVDAIALTEKKMDMTLDDIINMSKKNSTKGRLPPRAPNKSKFLQSGGPPPKGFKAKQFTDSRSAMRQGAFAKRRTNFNGKTNFPLTSNVAKKAASAPIHSRPTRWNQPRVVPAPSIQKVVVSNGPVRFDNGKKPQTMDALFARMQKLRRTNSQLTNGSSNTNRQVVQRPRPQVQTYQQQQRRRAYGPAPVYK